MLGGFDKLEHHSLVNQRKYLRYNSIFGYRDV